MTVFQAVILGLVQGLGEFLPISSSAHLVLVPWLFQWEDPGLSFDVALHMGTLIAVLAYFWRDWLDLAKGGIRGWNNPDGRLFWYLVVSCVPGAAIGYLLEDQAETLFRSPPLIAVMLIIMGLILYLVDRGSRKDLDIKHIDLKTSFLIGLSQALAIIPGVSRSGITMTTGLLLGLTRESAARFSFLLSAPIICGAALVKLPKLLAEPGALSLPFVSGMLVASVAGLASIHFLLRYLRTESFLPFAWYRFILGAAVIVVAVVRW